MTKVIDGRKYLMRDQRPLRTIRKWYAEYCQKSSKPMTMHQWLIYFGKVYKEIK